MQPKQPDDPVFTVALLALLSVTLSLVMIRVAQREMREELAIARERRDELQEQLNKRERQLDGALERINELAPDPAGE